MARTAGRNQLAAAHAARTGGRRPAAFGRVLTQNGTMLKLFRYLETMARTTHAVLLGGETGPGKELIAEAMH